MARLSICVVPVFGDLAAEDKEICRAMALASLRESWHLAEKYGSISDEDIEAEINRVRSTPESEDEKLG